MSEDKSSRSRARSYIEMGEFWDTHDASDYWDEVHAAEFDTDTESQSVYYPIDIELAQGMRAVAKRLGVPPKVLLTQWVQEKLSETASDVVEEPLSHSSV